MQKRRVRPTPIMMYAPLVRAYHPVRVVRLPCESPKAFRILRAADASSLNPGAPKLATHTGQTFRSSSTVGG
jgi:hypothetical protein